MTRAARLFLAAALAIPPGFASAAPPAPPVTVQVDRPWARATPPGATIGAGYLELRNPGSTADRLVRATTPRAATVQIHETQMADGMMQMREVDGLNLPPGATVRLEPGGTHLMLVDLPRPLVAGERVPLILHFARAGQVTVELVVAPPGSPGPVP